MLQKTSNSVGGEAYAWLSKQQGLVGGS